MRTTSIRWRPVDPGEAERFGIGCSTFGYCRNRAAWCRQWQTGQMSAPAFYYFCADHAAEGAAQDGIALGEAWPPAYGRD